MKWIINYELMPDKESNEKASIVINDIVNEFERLIPNDPPLGYKPVHLVNDRSAGPTLFWPLGKDYYQIGLNISDVFYNQVAFQFSQEFTRIYCDPRINNWFIELVCHVAALYMLDFLGAKWELDPPIDELQDYHENFTNYRSNLLGAAFSKIDMVKYQISNEWVEYQVQKLVNKEHTNRGKLLLIAYELLGLFNESEENWQILPYIGKCSMPSPPEDAKNLNTNRNAKPDFNQLLEEVPQNIKPFVQKLIDKFGVFKETDEEEPV
jgi:hypothetical protein